MKEKKSNFKGRLVNSYKKQKEAKSGFGYFNLPKGVEMFKLPEDVRTFDLDFVPYKVTNERHLDRNAEEGFAIAGSLWYRSPIKVHRNVGADNETVICPTTVGKKCPICEYRIKRIKEGADKEEFKLLYPQERSVYAIIPLEKGFEQVPMPWDMSDFLFQETLMEELAENEDNENFFTLENGKTVHLRLRWKEISKNKYPEVVSIDFEDREPYDDAVLEDVPNLDEMVKVLSYDEIFAKFFNEEISDDKIEEVKDDGDDDPQESTRKKYRGRTKTSDDEEEEKEEKKVTPPVRRQRKPASDESDVIEKEKEEPVTSRRTRTERTSSKDKCPYGYTFGVDTDKYKECEKCEIWDECDEQKEKNSK
jgi:hypothetical protein